MVRPARERRLLHPRPGAARQLHAPRLARACAGADPAAGSAGRRRRAAGPRARRARLTSSSLTSTSSASRIPSRGGGTDGNAVGGDEASPRPTHLPRHRARGRGGAGLGAAGHQAASRCGGRRRLRPRPRRHRAPPSATRSRAEARRSSGSPQALVQVPAYVSRIGESLRAGDRANLLDQADELRGQTGADWVLITDGAGVLQAWTARAGHLRRGLLPRRADRPSAGGAGHRRALARADRRRRRPLSGGRRSGGESRRAPRRSASWLARFGWTAPSRRSSSGTPTPRSCSSRSTRGCAAGGGLHPASGSGWRTSCAGRRYGKSTDSTYARFQPARRRRRVRRRGRPAPQRRRRAARRIRRDSTRATRSWPRTAS